MNERDIVSLLITKPFKIGIRFFLKKGKSHTYFGLRIFSDKSNYK